MRMPLMQSNPFLAYSTRNDWYAHSQLRRRSWSKVQSFWPLFLNFNNDVVRKKKTPKLTRFASAYSFLLEGLMDYVHIGLMKAMCIPNLKSFFFSNCIIIIFIYERNTMLFFVIFETNMGGKNIFFLGGGLKDIALKMIGFIYLILKFHYLCT